MTCILASALPAHIFQFSTAIFICYCCSDALNPTLPKCQWFAIIYIDSSFIYLHSCTWGCRSGPGHHMTSHLRTLSDGAALMWRVCAQCPVKRAGGLAETLLPLKILLEIGILILTCIPLASGHHTAKPNTSGTGQCAQDRWEGRVDVAGL